MASWNIPLPLLFLTLLLSAALFNSTFSSSADDKPSAYQILQEYGFPPGLLPQGVTGYELNKQTGEFKAHLRGDCKYYIEGYQLEYKPTITGVISDKRVTDLKGVKVHVVIMWVNIVEVTLKGDDLDFSVGIASANFPAENFAECPRCGCGFDCNAVAEGGLVSSL